MNSNQNPIRVFGQRSIPSSFISRSSNPFKDCKEDVNNKASKKDLPVSLSDFLDRKVHKSSVLPKTVQGKASPFSSPVVCREIGGFTDGQIGVKKEGEGEKKCVLDKVVFEQFKHTSAEKVDCVASCDVGETGKSSINDVQESRKRRNPFEGADAKDTTRKHVLVLGDDPKPKQDERQARFISKKKRRPLYNHYANGCGWWDCDMEGVDDEEVGFGEVWEGVGSTTYGGIEWH